ncbi:hypothetical protein AMTR_s00141p00029830 [Amborella trichopoda]|uniref:Uncharacterized protein n=1 Tax=Amborella trichopoda TaxID=13333 RepID=W1PIQ7_AMBTC|nr:hypothetical protein AMTR_s00141p00029830 [Amborella trichopoda]
MKLSVAKSLERIARQVTQLHACHSPTPHPKISEIASMHLISMNGSDHICSHNLGTSEPAGQSRNVLAMVGVR